MSGFREQYKEMLKQKKISKQNNMRLLVKLPNYIADIIMCIPSLYALRRIFPASEHHQIHLLINSQLVDLLNGQDCFDNVIHPAWNEHKVMPWKVSKRLRREGSFDAVINFSRQWRFAIGFWMARIPLRAGYSFFGSRFVLTCAPRPIPKGIKGDYQPPEYYFDLLRSTVEDVPEGLLSQRELFKLIVSDETKKEAEEAMKKGLMSSQYANKPYFPESFYIVVPGVSPGKYGRLRQWPLENYVGVTSMLDQIQTIPKPVPLFLFGSKDKDLYEIFQEKYSHKLPSKRIVIKPGSISLRHVIALIRKSEFILTGDTGPRHIAAALDKEIKVVTIFGPTSLSRSCYRPDLEFPIWVNVVCNESECKTKKCLEKHICMTSVTPQLVLRSILDFVYEKNE